MMHTTADRATDRLIVMGAQKENEKGGENKGGKAKTWMSCPLRLDSPKLHTAVNRWETDEKKALLILGIPKRIIILSEAERSQQ